MYCPLAGDRHLDDALVALPVEVDLAVGLLPRQEGPAAITDHLQVVGPVVQGQDPVAVSPDEADQFDTADDRLVVAGPVAMPWFDRLGVVLVESGVVEYEDAVSLFDERLDLAAEDLGSGTSGISSRV